MVLGFINSLQKQQIFGRLDSTLTLRPDCIIIDNEKFFLEDIRLVKFYIGDYIGKQISTQFGLWEMFSNGIDNKIIIILNSGESIVERFQMIGDNELMWAFDSLYAYYNAGKMIKRNYEEITL